MLKVENLFVSYGGIQALQGISIEVPGGKIISLLGANGAGKSTTLRTIMGIVKANKGSVLFNGEEILGLQPDVIVKKGIALVPEGRRVFTNLTVTENLALGAYTRTDKAGIAKDIEDVYYLFPRLKERETQPAGTLSGGEQQMLALGRAMMLQPKLLMIDEPSLGLSPVLSQGVLSKLKELNQTRKQTILLIEQNARAALSIADYAYILSTGQITIQGPAAQLAADDGVRRSYLGIN